MLKRQTLSLRPIVVFFPQVEKSVRNFCLSIKNSLISITFLQNPELYQNLDIIIKNLEKIYIKLKITSPKILKQLINGTFTDDYMDYIKKTYLVKYYSKCFNNSYLSDLVTSK